MKAARLGIPSSWPSSIPLCTPHLRHWHLWCRSSCSHMWCKFVVTHHTIKIKRVPFLQRQGLLCCAKPELSDRRLPVLGWVQILVQWLPRFILAPFLSGVCIGIGVWSLLLLLPLAPPLHWGRQQHLTCYWGSTYSSSICLLHLHQSLHYRLMSYTVSQPILWGQRV